MNQQVYERMVAEMRKKRAEQIGNVSAGTSKIEGNTAGKNDTAKPSAKPTHPTVTLRGVVERITYQNPENGYTVLKCAVKNHKDLVTVIGSLLDVNDRICLADLWQLEGGQ